MKYLLGGEETSRLRFRTIEETDFNDWLPFFEDPESFRYWNTKLESPKVECLRWYDKQFGRYNHDNGGMNALIEKSSDKLIGHCGLLIQHVDNVIELEIGYSLLRRFWNMGYASEAARKCRDVAFTHNYFPSLVSIINLANTPSARVAIKNAMTIDKQTVYYENQVNIFRITREKWASENEPTV